MKTIILVDSNTYRSTAQKEMSKLNEEMSQILKSDLEESEKSNNIAKLFKGIYHLKKK